MLRKGPNALWEGGEGVEGEVDRCFVTLFSELTERSEGYEQRAKRLRAVCASKSEFVGKLQRA